MLTVFNGYTTHTNGALGDGLLLLFHVFFSHIASFINHVGRQHLSSQVRLLHKNKPHIGVVELPDIHVMMPQGHDDIYIWTKKTDIWLWLGILRDSNHKIKPIKLSVLTIVFQCFSWVWGFCPSCPYDETHFFVKSPYRLRPTCVPLCKARWKVPGVGTSARNGGAPKSWSRSFTTGATVSDGGVRVWLDFVWCQRTSAEIKIEIQSTSFNFGEKTGVQSLTKKRDCIFWCCPSTEGILPCAWIHLLGWSFHNSPRPAMCPRGTHPTHFPAVLGFEVYSGTTGFNRLIGLIYSYSPLLNNYDWFQ